MDWSETYEYLSARGEPYGIDVFDMINHTPSIIQTNPEAIFDFWQDKDISHIVATSVAPDLADDPANWIAEDPGSNRSRQENEMSDLDELHAQMDNFIDALWSNVASIVT